MKVGSHATPILEPGQGRKAAAVRGSWRVPWGDLAGATAPARRTSRPFVNGELHGHHSLSRVVTGLPRGALRRIVRRWLTWTIRFALPPSCS